MNRIKINFNPTPEQVLEATEYMGNTANYDRVVGEMWTPDENAINLFGSYSMYLNQPEPLNAAWLVHFLLVYRTAKGEVQS